MGRVSTDPWRSVAAQLAALALLLRALLLPAGCAPGLESLAAPADEKAAVLALLDAARYGALCSHGPATDEDGGSPSKQPGKSGHHPNSACCSSCCTVATAAAAAVIPVPQEGGQVLAGHSSEAILPASYTITRNRSPPAFLSA